MIHNIKAGTYKLMKLTMNVPLTDNNASEYLLILVDQDQIQTAQSFVSHIWLRFFD